MCPPFPSSFFFFFRSSRSRRLASPECCSRHGSLIRATIASAVDLASGSCESLRELDPGPSPAPSSSFAHPSPPPTSSCQVSSMTGLAIALSGPVSTRFSGCSSGRRTAGEAASSSRTVSPTDRRALLTKSGAFVVMPSFRSMSTGINWRFARVFAAEPSGPVSVSGGFRAPGGQPEVRSSRRRLFRLIECIR